MPVDHVVRRNAVSHLSRSVVPSLLTPSQSFGNFSALFPQFIGIGCPTTAIPPTPCRWKPLTARVPTIFGFTHLAYITPSEFLGDSIFPMAGGFAYLHRDDGIWQEREEEGGQREIILTTLQKSRFFPIVAGGVMVDDITTDSRGNLRKLNRVTELGCKDPDTEGVPIVRKMAEKRHLELEAPMPYNTPLLVDELLAKTQERFASQDKFVGTSPEQAIFAAGTSAALGLPSVLGYESERGLVAKVCATLQINTAEFLDNEDELMLKILEKVCIGGRMSVQPSSPVPHSSFSTVLFQQRFCLCTGVQGTEGTAGAPQVHCRGTKGTATAECSVLQSGRGGGGGGSKTFSDFA